MTDNQDEQQSPVEEPSDDFEKWLDEIWHEQTYGSTFGG